MLAEFWNGRILANFEVRMRLLLGGLNVFCDLGGRGIGLKSFSGFYWFCDGGQVTLVHRTPIAKCGPLQVLED